MPRSAKRLPLGEVPASRLNKRLRSPEGAALLPPPPTKKTSSKAAALPSLSPPPPAQKALSKTAQQLLAVSPEVARITLQRLKDGYTQKSGAGYPAMKMNAAGCWLAQKGANRADNGYIQVSPVVLSGGRGVAGAHKEVVLPQGAHRMAVRAWKSEEEFLRIVLDGEEASHLCHQKICFNPDHIVVEPKWLNELRKLCAAYGAVITLVNFMGRVHRVLPKVKCTCRSDKKCIMMVQDGELELANDNNDA